MAPGSLPGVFSSAGIKKRAGNPGAESYSVIGIYRYDEHPHSDVALISVGHYLAATSETSIRLDSLIDPPFFSHYSSSGIHPRALLGMPDKVSFAVEAHTGSGLTISSNEVRNLFERPITAGIVCFKQRELRPEEELILEHRYDEAFELLQQRLAEAPNDLDALWLLARFYYCDTRPLDESRGYAHQDLGRCLETLEKIAAVDPGPKVANAIAIVQELLEWYGD